VQRSLAIAVDPFPVDVVAEEPAGAIDRCVVVGPRTGLGEVLVDSIGDLGELFVVEHAADNDHTVFLEFGPLSRRHLGIGGCRGDLVG
jgi:hypothetical protein